MTQSADWLEAVRAPLFADGIERGRVTIHHRPHQTHVVVDGSPADSGRGPVRRDHHPIRSPPWLPDGTLSAGDPAACAVVPSRGQWKAPLWALERHCSGIMDSRPGSSPVRHRSGKPAGRRPQTLNVMVQLGGLEPPTSCSTDRRSNQLSYNCILDGGRSVRSSWGPGRRPANAPETMSIAALWQGHRTGLDNVLAALSRRMRRRARLGIRSGVTGRS